MNIKKLVVEFGAVFTATLFAIIFGIILTLVKSREIKENRVFKNLKQLKEGKK